MNAPVTSIREQGGRDSGRRMDLDQRRNIEGALWMHDRGWILGTPGGRPWTLSRTKRGFEALAALLLLLALAPLLLAIALAVKLSSRGPVLFVQERTGFRGRRFGMFKFRTMVANAETLKESLRHLNKHGADAIDFKIDRDPRITPIGRLLRRTSLDELPNIYPGITGLWQVSGRSDIDFDERVLLDMDYIQRQGPMLDLIILLRTPIEVLRGQGAA
ncbi:UDP-glucose:undecaprenyl-phosphate glucose-1-phosphate transferase [compost metagenome]